MADQCIVCLENLDCAIPLQQLQGDEDSGGSSSNNSNSSGSSGGPSGSTNSDLLTDLNHHHPLPLAAASPTASSTTENATTLKDLNGKDQQQPTHDSEDNIAVIQVCGHILHDTCLKAWTGKANSCPICRQAFHLVEVYDKIGGTSLLVLSANPPRN